MKELAKAVYDQRAYAESLTRDSLLAEDLMQDTILKCLLKPTELTGINLSRWARVVMHNSFVNMVRRNKVIYTHSEFFLENNLPLAPSADQEVRVNDIYLAIDKLKPMHQEAINLWISGYNYQDISRKVNIPLGTVKTRIRKARQVLSTELKLK